METKIALARLELALRELGAPIAGAFRPGANTREIRGTLAAEGLAAHHPSAVSAARTALVVFVVVCMSPGCAATYR